jgi:hypothetical protein
MTQTANNTHDVVASILQHNRCKAPGALLAPFQVLYTVLFRVGAAFMRRVFILGSTMAADPDLACVAQSDLEQEPRPITDIPATTLTVEAILS